LSPQNHLAVFGFAVLSPSGLSWIPALARKNQTEILVVAGREVAISHPDKVLFPKPKYTKLDLVRYYLAVAEGALRGAGGRPNMLVRYPDGIGREHSIRSGHPRAGPPGSR